MIRALLLASLLTQYQAGFSITSGVSAEDLADTPAINVVNMWEGTREGTNTLALTLAVTEGSTTQVDVRCYESSTWNGLTYAGFAPIELCDSATPKSACSPDVRNFTLSNYTAVDGVKYIKTRWETRDQFVYCTADDPDDSTGTVTITGTRTLAK